MAPLPTPRFGAAVVTGPDGLIYVIGGATATLSMTYATVEAYSIATNAWTTLPSLSQARVELSAAVGGDGRIYAMGGWQDASTQAPTDFVEAYVAGSGAAWQTEASLLEARHSFASATGADGLIYILGGTVADGLASQLEAFPVKGAWAAVSSGMTPRLGLSALFGPGGKLYALGGLDDTGAPSSLVEAWTPPGNAGSSGTWTTMPSMTQARAFFGAAMPPGNVIYAIAGDNGASLSLTNTTEAFTPAAAGGAWAPSAMFPFEEYAFGTTLGPDGRIYVVGGGGETGGNPTVFAYSPTAGTW
jgi:hypothetical protein